MRIQRAGGLNEIAATGWTRGSRIRRAVAASAAAVAVSVSFPGSASAAPPEIIEEQGYVVECTGEGGGYTANVFLFENSTVPPQEPTVLIETADGTQLVGVGPATEDLFSDPSINVEFAVEGGETATLTGTFSVTGSPTPVKEPAVRDENFVVLSTGSHRALTTDLTLEYNSTTIDLTCDPAFAFDLTTRRQAIGNNS
jgi:hypothetical protein